MVTGKCRLCLQTKQLISKSHILSDFFYRDIYGENHEAYVLPLDDLGQGKRVHSGEYEGGILCEDCDNQILGGYENYGSKFVFGSKDKNPLPGAVAQNQAHDGGRLKLTHIKGIDYARLKLFLLSLLWRASVSSRSFFQQVDLGKYEEDIRKMLHEGTPEEQLKFPCVVGIVTDRNKAISKGIIASPTKFRNDGCVAYQFLIGSLVLMFYVSPRGFPNIVKETAVNEKGEMRVLHLEGEVSDMQMKKVLGEKLHNHLVAEMA